jgi:hypothetical protein
MAAIRAKDWMRANGSISSCWAFAQAIGRRSTLQDEGFIGVRTIAPGPSST